MTVMLDKNKHMLKQITTLSTLMVNLSSCVKFDRYQGYDSAEQLNTVAQDLAKNRDLYASEYISGVIDELYVKRTIPSVLRVDWTVCPQPATVPNLLDWMLILIDFAFGDN